MDWIAVGITAGIQVAAFAYNYGIFGEKIRGLESKIADHGQRLGQLSVDFIPRKEAEKHQQAMTDRFDSEIRLLVQQLNNLTEQNREANNLVREEVRMLRTEIVNLAFHEKKEGGK